DPDATLRREALFAIGHADWEPAGPADRRPAVADALEDASPEIRAFACWAAGRLHDARAVPRLVALLRDPDAPVRREAAAALGCGALGGRDVLPHLRDVARGDADAAVRAAAARAIEIIEKVAAQQPR